MSDSLQPHELQHTRAICPPLSPWVCSNISIELVMPFNHLILCWPLLLLPSVFPSIRVFSNELALSIRWPKYCTQSNFRYVADKYAKKIQNIENSTETNSFFKIFYSNSHRMAWNILNLAILKKTFCQLQQNNVMYNEKKPRLAKVFFVRVAICENCPLVLFHLLKIFFVSKQSWMAIFSRKDWPFTQTKKYNP